MAVKRNGILLPAIFAVLILAVIWFIVRNKGNSPVQAATAWIADKIEGFSVTPTTALKCPDGWQFFNDSAGASFCCGGSVNPYSHTCTAMAPGRLCAFQPNTPDPRGVGLPRLPLCGALRDSLNENSASNFCPRALPNYATKGKCCASATDVDGEDCSPLDLAVKTRYCVVKDPKAGEQLCGNMKVGEMGTCPAGMSRMTYTLGEKEAKAYGPAAIGQAMPVCFNMEASCMPDDAIKEVQKKGIFKNKNNLSNWRYACSGYKRRFIDKDMTGQMDMNYV